MKDMERPRETIFKTFREGLTQKHPKAFNIFLILALISLVTAGTFLLSDIVSFKSNAAQKGPFGGLYLKMPKEIQTTVKNWQETCSDLIGQLKSTLGVKGPINATVKDAANRDKARALLAKNKIAKAKEARTGTENLSHRKNSVVSSNASRTPALVQPQKATSAIIIGSWESEGSSYSPSNSGEDSSPKRIENNHQVVAVTSNISENQLNSNRSISNDSVSNESVMSESPLNGPVMNESSLNKSSISELALNESGANESVSDESLLNEPVINGSSKNRLSISDSTLNESDVNESVSDESLLNESVMGDSILNESVVNESEVRQSNTNQSGMSINLGSNTSSSLSATDQESNSTRNSSYPVVPRNTNLSFDNHSLGLVALPQSQTDFAASNSAETHDRITQDGNGSDTSTPPKFNNTNIEIHIQNQTSNLLVNIDSSLDEKAKNELEGAMLKERSNTTSDALVSSPKDIPPNSVPETSDITPNPITRSLGPDSPPTGNTLLAANSTSQLQEQKQNQTYNLNESKPLLDGSSIPLPLPDNQAEGLQNLAEKSENTATKTVSTGSASAKFQESKKSRLVNKPNVRTLRTPTPRG